MSLGPLATVFVLAVLLHNGEEFLLLPAWSVHAGRWHRPVIAAEFGFAVSVLSLLLVGIGLWAFVQGPGSVGAYLFFGYVFAMAANALMPHLLATLVLRRYMPGTLTGVGLNLPLGIWLLHEALGQGWVAADTLVWVAPAVAIALVVSIPALFAAGRRPARRTGR